LRQQDRSRRKRPRKRQTGCSCCHGWEWSRWKWPSDLSLSILIAAAAVLLIAVGATLAVYDVFYRRLPNWIVALLLFLSSIHAVLYLGWSGFALAASHGLVALLVGALLFHWGLIGGGDAKFYAAIAAGVPWERAIELLWWTSIGGLALLILLLGPVLARRRQKEKSSFAVPFGVAIFFGLAGVTAL
jgi:prepilin peptidase CpaA